MKPDRPKSPVPPGQTCPIVGIGASAGGLEAFTQVLKQLPLDSGFGFVLVQHLDPSHESALTQLLARATAMPVREAVHNLQVEANHVYVIPPNTSMGIGRGRLLLQPRLRNGAAARSIDFFFEALAGDQQERAIGVILSGNASDGTIGLEAIKAAGGLTFAQDGSARYDSMPRNAIAAGCVDAVLAPAHIARELARIARHPYLARPASAMPKAPRAGATAAAPADRPESDGYKKVLLLLRNHCGVDFSLYKTSTIHRRITRRAVLNHRDSLESYAVFLRGNAKELNALHADALISVTSFFRNADAFAVLKSKVLARLLQQRASDPLRVWVLGCSTGQEAYSIAMLFTEAAEKSHRPRQLQVFATDLSEANLEKARHGLYPRSAVADVSPERLRRFFGEEEGGYRVIKSLREVVVFARHNLISDPPFSRMDLITCRNVMIYLEPGLQKKVLPAFHYALKPEGYLFLGASESIGGSTDLFTPLDKKQKIFARKSAPIRSFQLPVRSERAGPGPTPRRPAMPGRDGMSEFFRGELTAEREADRLTVNQFAPPSVLIGDDLQILQFRGPTSRYLEPPTGKAQFSLLKMARKGLLLPLRTVINRAKKDGQTTRQENVPFQSEGQNRTVHLEVVPLKNLKEPRFLVLFEDPDRRSRNVAETIPPAPLDNRHDEAGHIAGLEQELAETRDYLQSIQEHQEAANEELQASNEEGQSANEELQSLNEELETSKEELESTNEELTTVNEEMVSRNAELNRLNSDLTNLQTSTKLVILLLGRDLAIRRFSAEAEKQFSLHASDVGRSLGGIRHNLNLPDLEALVARVIATGTECACEVPSRDGHWYSLRVRPYLTSDHKVDGAVLVLVDINAAKTAEQAFMHARDFAEAIIGSVRDPLLILDADLRVRKANESFFTTFRVSPAKTIGQPVFKLGGGNWNIPRLRKLLLEILPRQNTFNDFEVSHDFEALGRRTMLLNARTLSQVPGHHEKILLGFQDVTVRKRAEALANQLAAIVEFSSDAIIGKDLKGIITSWNRGAEKIFGYKSREMVGTSIRRLIPGNRQDEEDLILGKIKRGDSMQHFETQRRHRDKRLIDVSITASPIMNGAGKVIGASKVARDITARKQTEQLLAETRKLLDGHATQLESLVGERTAQLTASNRQLVASVDSVRQGKAKIEQQYDESQVMQKKLRHLTHQILTAQEEERKKISRELHDEVVQTLVGINVELSALVHGNSAGVRHLKDKIARTQRLVEKSVDAVHRFARDLRPAVLDDLGLIPALHAFCKGLAARKKFKIHLTSFAGIESLESNKRTVLYRVTQEALTNVARHARATRVRLNIVRIPGAVRLEIHDNGKSFSVRKLFRAKTKRLGLVGMKERVEMVGGSLTIESTRGHGTTVRAEIPFKPENTKQ